MNITNFFSGPMDFRRFLIRRCLKTFVGISNTALELRTCHLCNSGDIETELHLLFDCYMYNNERQDLYSKITNTDFTNLTNVEKLLYLFKHQLFIFAGYVENIFVKRRTALYNQV